MLKSIAKILLQSRGTTIHRIVDGGRIMILANGPSLADTIRDRAEELKQCNCMAVNFAANTPQFFDIKPRYYIMADPHFFDKLSDENVARLYDNLRKTTWPMTMLVPRQYQATARRQLSGTDITILTFNFVGLEGPAAFERHCYRHRLGMPRPRNVLIPALMCAIWLGYDDIKVAGADHSWLQSIWVDNQNHVVSVQPHFYKEDKKEEQRIRSDYKSYHLHDILLSFHIAFKSYFGVRRFADSLGVKITNITPGSYIDAFEREP